MKIQNKRVKHISLTDEEYALSKKLLEYCELWYVDETPKPIDELFVQFMKKNRKIKKLLTPDKVHKILNAYSKFCDVVREIKNEKI